MTTPIVFSSRVISDLRALPESDRIAVVSAIAVNMLLGVDATDSLTPMETVVYTLIQNTIKRDTARYQRTTA